MLKNKLLSAMGGSEPSDPYFKYTTLLLHGDGTNGAQNNTFIDSSANNFTITRNGNVTQGSFSPYGDLWSNYFDGTDDYLQTPSSTAFDFGTGDFTIEFWVYVVGSNPRPIGIGDPTVNGNNAITFYISSTMLSCAFGGRNTYQNNTLTAGAYNHIALTRQSGTVRYFANGVQTSETFSYTGNAGGNYPVYINAALSSGNLYIGSACNISNVRIVKGTALYTGNFTPSTTPLTAVSGTSLLTCQSNRFKDNSSNNFTITRTGDVSVQRFSPFANSAEYSTSVNGGSGYFDGTGDFLSISTTSTLTLSGDYTIEGWFYVKNTSAGYKRLFNNAPGSTPSGYYYVYTSGLNLHMYNVDVGSLPVVGSFIGNSWFHLAISRSGSTTRVFVNGVQTHSYSGTTTFFNNGWFLGGGPDTEFSNIFVTDHRVVVGFALYTANFTPPTAPLTAVTNTSLLLNFTNAGIYDNTGMNNLETVGNAQISTSVKKYGTGSMYFDGSGDYLLGTNTPNMDLSGVDFTVEFWIYLNATQSYPCIVGKNSYPGNLGWAVFIDTNNKISFYYNGINKITVNSELTNNVWHHVAVVRASSGLVNIYINGVSSAYAPSVTFGNSAYPFSVGGTSTLAGWDNTYSLNGYIDDLRITKGVARYTANFVPPARAFPDK